MSAISHVLPRLHVSSPLHAAAEIVLTPAQAHYLQHVLRMRVGATLLLFNGQEGEWLAEITVLGKHRCTARTLECTRAQTALQDFVYCFAPLKQARLDYMVQKAVELGVSALQPVMTAHTVVHKLNLERMRANVIEAAEQCGILSLAEVRLPLKFQNLLKNWDTNRIMIYCDERAAVASSLDALRTVAGSKLGLFIGPEGGFSEEERKDLLKQAWVRPLSLGPRIMRADTAAVAGLALVNAVLGDWR